MTEKATKESGLQYYTGVKKHGKEYMKKAAQAGREGASQEELGRLKDKYSKAEKKKPETTTRESMTTQEYPTKMIHPKKGITTAKNENEAMFLKRAGYKFADMVQQGKRKVLHPKYGKSKGAMIQKEGLADLADMAERDHEVQMARSDLYKIAKYAIKLHEMMKNVSEAEGIQGWQQSKITKAADYMDSVYHSLDYEMNMDKGMMPESVKPKRFKPVLTNEEYDSYKGNLNSKLKKKM